MVSRASDEVRNSGSSSQPTDERGRYLCMSGKRIESLSHWDCGAVSLGPADVRVIKEPWFDRVDDRRAGEERVGPRRSVNQEEEEKRENNV